MNIDKYVSRIQRMDSLIKSKATGKPEVFADRVNVSRSTLMSYITLLKKLGGPISYDMSRESYFYMFDCELKIGYETTKLTKEELSEIQPKRMKKICDNLIVR